MRKNNGTGNAIATAAGFVRGDREAVSFVCVAQQRQPLGVA